MKICGYCRVKDEADIIESFCRWHLVFFDALVIWDDNSSDRTVEIIQSLIDEGLAIELLHLKKEAQILIDFEFDELVAQNARCMYIFKKYDADWVVPLDADEFIFCDTGINPRIELEKLDENKHYLFYWRTGVYSSDPVDSSIFLPNYFFEYRDPALDIIYKTILSRTLVEKWGAALTSGKHDLGFREDIDITAKPLRIYHPIIRYAHFPIRSKAHALSKAICSQLRVMSVDGYAVFQYKRIYNDIVSEGLNISNEKVRNFSLEYALLPNQMTGYVNSIRSSSGIINSDFLSDDIQLLYTNYNDNNFLRTILLFIEVLINKMKDDKKKVITETSGMLHEMNTLVEDLNRVNLELREQLDSSNK